MIPRSVILRVNPEETLRLTRISFDEDKDEAFLLSIKECFIPE